ncbi:hypothetical protein [Shimia sediminis]|uniref:hypothetical protein n=1 Tax=Shimia sediminis TaxID=2497945 RepID=UPI000F8E9F17|nr:hypothetical protein [Shimia sediminis]
MTRGWFTLAAGFLVWATVVLFTLVLPPAPAFAEQIDCRVFAREAIHSSTHKRARLFVATDSTMPDDILALGYATALNEVANYGLDFATVYVTRLLDGTNRDDHTSATALAIVSFNPGNTPVIKSRLEGRVVRTVVTDPGELAVMVAPKENVDELRIMRAYLDAKERGEGFECLGR